MKKLLSSATRNILSSERKIEESSMYVFKYNAVEKRRIAALVHFVRNLNTFFNMNMFFGRRTYDKMFLTDFS